jgi:hypothetical protein
VEFDEVELLDELALDPELPHAIAVAPSPATSATRRPAHGAVHRSRSCSITGRLTGHAASIPARPGPDRMTA